MQTILFSREEVARRARELYNDNIRQNVETEQNIGKMVVIDIETGEYSVDRTGLESARHLREKLPFARLFGIRVGYNVAVSLGGIMELDTPRSKEILERPIRHDSLRCETLLCLHVR